MKQLGDLSITYGSLAGLASPPEWAVRSTLVTGHALEHRVDLHAYRVLRNVPAEMEDIVAQSMSHRRTLLARHNAQSECYAEELLNMLCCEFGNSNRLS